MVATNHPTGYGINRIRHTLQMLLSREMLNFALAA